jgi:nucleoside-diphosphate-sugar epimerase
MNGSFIGPLNIGSEEMVTIDRLAQIAMDIARKPLSISHIPGPTGVRGRNSDNRLMREKLGWEPTMPLKEGIEKTYRWINEQVRVASSKKEIVGV